MFAVNIDSAHFSSNSMNLKQLMYKYAINLCMLISLNAKISQFRENILERSETENLKF